MNEEMNEEVKQIRAESLLSAGEVARVLNVSKSFAYQLMQRGSIPKVRIGRAVRVRPEDLNHFITQNVTSQDVRA